MVGRNDEDGIKELETVRAVGLVVIVLGATVDLVSMKYRSCARLLIFIEIAYIMAVNERTKAFGS